MLRPQPRRHSKYERSVAPYAPAPTYLGLYRTHLSGHGDLGISSRLGRLKSALGSSASREAEVYDLPGPQITYLFRVP